MCLRRHELRARRRQRGCEGRRRGAQGTRLALEPRDRSRPHNRARGATRLPPWPSPMRPTLCRNQPAANPPYAARHTAQRDTRPLPTGRSPHTALARRAARHAARPPHARARPRGQAARNCAAVRRPARGPPPPSVGTLPSSPIAGRARRTTQGARADKRNAPTTCTFGSTSTDIDANADAHAYTNRLRDYTMSGQMSRCALKQRNGTRMSPRTPQAIRSLALRWVSAAMLDGLKPSASKHAGRLRSGAGQISEEPTTSLPSPLPTVGPRIVE